MATAYRWLASLLFAAIVVQVGIAGYGAFAASALLAHRAWTTGRLPQATPAPGA
jgi:hypothetical protein